MKVKTSDISNWIEYSQSTIISIKQKKRNMLSNTVQGTVSL
jgi:hypothetical protein